MRFAKRFYPTAVVVLKVAVLLCADIDTPACILSLSLYGTILKPPLSPAACQAVLST
jgi:hypothetical protein